jgi:diguanylate cyclase (GGDEF)-like protein
MIPAPLSPLEDERLTVLRRLAILDTPEEQEFNDAVDLARDLFDCPMALVSLVDEHRQWFKARCGVDAAETPRDQAFCAHALLEDDVMVVEDATRDARFVGNPLVTGRPNIRFYAGVPLRPLIPEVSNDVPAVGTLCILDTKPRSFSRRERGQLRKLGGLVNAIMRTRVFAATAYRLSGEIHETAATVHRTNRQLQQAERLAGLGSWRLDLATQRVEWSDQVFAIYELPVGGALPLELALHYYPEAERRQLSTLVTEAIRTGQPFDWEGDIITARDVRRRVRAMGEVELADGKAAALIGIFQDVTERHQYEQKLKQTANTDSLTGLPNRAMFEEQLAATDAQYRSGGNPYAVILIDLDGFKPVNDNFGHQAGDGALRVIADKLRDKPFTNAFAARLGGDEFVMLVHRPRDCADLPQVVQQLLRELRHVVDSGGEKRAVTATVGAALVGPDVANGTELLRRADLALYAAKRSKRGTGQIYGSTEQLRAWGASIPIAQSGAR